MSAEAELIIRDRRSAGTPDAVPAVAAPAGPVTPMYLLQLATSQGADLDRLEKLMELQERWEANEARKAYVAAMAAFKADPPVIVKNKHVHFTSQRGTVDYNHATHDEVTNKISAGLGRHGLAHAFKVDQGPEGIRVTCTLTHQLGHSESVSLVAKPDESGSKNSIQAVGSTVTYLQRYTLLSITGLSTAEMAAADDDGRGAGEDEPPKPTPEIPVDVKTAISEASGWPELESIYRELSAETRTLILVHHRDGWDGQKARCKAATARQTEGAK